MTVSIVRHSLLMGEVFLSDSFFRSRGYESCGLTGLGIFLLLSRVLRISSSLFQSHLGKLVQTVSAWVDC